MITAVFMMILLVPVPTDTRLQNTALDRDGWGGGGLLVTTSPQARENPAPSFFEL